MPSVPELRPQEVVTQAPLPAASVQLPERVPPPGLLLPEQSGLVLGQKAPLAESAWAKRIHRQPSWSSFRVLGLVRKIRKDYGEPSQ